jgi:hypothetical protein
MNPGKVILSKNGAGRQVRLQTIARPSRTLSAWLTVVSKQDKSPPSEKGLEPTSRLLSNTDVKQTQQI